MKQAIKTLRVTMRPDYGVFFRWRKQYKAMGPGDGTIDGPHPLAVAILRRFNPSIATEYIATISTKAPRYSADLTVVWVRTERHGGRLFAHMSGGEPKTLPFGICEEYRRALGLKKETSAIYLTFKRV